MNGRLGDQVRDPFLSPESKGKSGILGKILKGVFSL